MLHVHVYSVGLVHAGMDTDTDMNTETDTDMPECRTVRHLVSLALERKNLRCGNWSGMSKYLAVDIHKQVFHPPLLT
jgi:hypothetical protein